MSTAAFLKQNALLLLLVFFPVALVLEWLVHASALAIFATSALAVIPLAGLMGRATEQLAERLGEGAGGLLNATFGNAAELIIALIAVRAGLYDLVKASITGSIIGNVLLVFGLSALVGGLRFPVQRFNRTAASLGATLLVISVVGLVLPAIYHQIAEGATGTVPEQELSLEIAIVLMATYLLSLVFTLKTHAHLYTGGVHGADGAGAAAPRGDAADADRPGAVAEPGEAAGEGGGDSGPGRDAGGAGAGHPSPSMGRSIGLLLASTIGIAIMAELLVGAAEAAGEALGWNEVFVGVIVVAIIGNAAEHSSAVLMAAKDRMDAAIQIAVGSSIQIALFVAPLLVFLSYLIGPRPMDLLFTNLEVVAVGLSVLIISFISHDGESHYMEGVQLLAVYAMLGMAFFALPH